MKKIEIKKNKRNLNLFKKGQSGNPKGRPIGTFTSTNKIRKMLLVEQNKFQINILSEIKKIKQGVTIITPTIEGAVNAERKKIIDRWMSIKVSPTEMESPEIIRELRKFQDFLDHIGDNDIKT